MNAAQPPEDRLPLSRYGFPFYASRIPDGENTVRPHWHYEMEILYAEAEGTLTVDSRTYPLCPPDLFFLNPRRVHQIERQSPGDVVRLVFDLSILLSPGAHPNGVNHLIDRLVKGSVVFPEHPDGALAEKLLPLVRSLSSHADHEIRPGAESCEILSLLFSLLAVCIRADAFREAPEETQKGVRLVMQIMEAVRARYAESMSVEKLAEEAGISPAYLHRLFRSYTGITPAAYIKTVRLRASCRLLEEGLSVSQVAAAVGIPDTSYFIKLFRDATGMTPHKWIRERQRAESAPEKTASSENGGITP
ncbi:MAG: AraC family transcriptional regulator [Clostridia bacterium]|nr:AraC family transcriptional regulator [Clostridia bacterium]MCR4907164.1 AraC family transcriptional regulator [Clostridiales bacterium]